MTTSQRSDKSLKDIIRHVLCRWLCDDSEPPPPEPPKQKPISFIPGELCIVADYPLEQDADPAKIHAAITDVFRKRLDQRLKDLRVEFPRQRVAVVHGRDRVIANVVGYFPDLKDKPERLLDLARQIHKEIALPPVPSEPQGDWSRYPEKSSQRPNTQRSTLAAVVAPAAGGSDVPPTELRLRAASVNWVMGSATKDIIGGGPGADPIRVTSVASVTSGSQPWQFTLPAPYDTLAEGEQIQLVEVAVLDTIPETSVLENARTLWTIDPTNQNQVMLDLLGGAGSALLQVGTDPARFRLDNGDRLELNYRPVLPDVVLGNYPYRISSHGLFIAGIIRSIASHVKIHMIRVLNEDGAGSMDGLIAGFGEIGTRPVDAPPLLVNCSLMILAPLEELDLQQSLQDIIAVLRQNNVAIIAAAGNDGGAGPVRPQALPPAAYTTVTGIGALNRNSTPTDYSNMSDTPETLGIATFGGNRVVSATGNVTDAQDGILGIFIDTFPNNDPSTTGWARWAGTSFATPIVVAGLANALARSAPGAGAVQAVNALIGQLGFTPGNIGEIFEVTQG